MSPLTTKYFSLSRKEFTAILRLSIPLLIMRLTIASISFFEIIFLGHLGQESLAAGAIVAAGFNVTFSIFDGIFNSINILVAYKYGEKNYDAISIILRNGIVLAIVLSILTSFLLRNMSYLYIYFGQKPQIVPLAASYLDALSWGVLPRYVMTVLIYFFTGLGRIRIAMVFTLAFIPFYILLSFVLIFGYWGFPNLAIAGAGWATSICDWFVMLIVCAYTINSKYYKKYMRHFYTLTDISKIKEFLKLGIPMGLMFSIEFGFVFVLTLLMGYIGIETLAAQQITMQYLAPFITAIFCIAQAITITMSHQLGARQSGIAERLSYAGIIIGIIFSLIIGFLYWFTPDILIHIDLDHSTSNNIKTINLAKEFLYIAAFYQIFESIRLNLFAALRSLKDTGFALLCSVMCNCCLSFPIGYLLAIYLKKGGVGFWWGMIVGVCFNVTFLFIRYQKIINTMTPSTKS